jgi:hypothetical protein
MNSDVDVFQGSDITPLSEPSELRGAITSLMEDVLDPETNMSSMDMRSRLTNHEIGAILAIDTLVALDALPKQALLFTRQKKRLSVSLGGEGRKEIVQLSQAQQDKDGSRTLGASLMGMFRGGNS